MVLGPTQASDFVERNSLAFCCVTRQLRQSCCFARSNIQWIRWVALTKAWVQVESMGP